MKIDILVAEIGSTTTIVNAFDVNNNLPIFLGRGVANTTVDSDVNEGLKTAINDLARYLKTSDIEYHEMFASSSAAGGLRVTVHGLVYEMTVRASKEAALNAGANIHLVTAGKLSTRNIEEINKLKPNMIIVAGGTDYGETETALNNMKKILKMALDIPIIYAGNIENQSEIRELFTNENKNHLLKIVDNVYPRVDQLNILPLRRVIYETFEEHIVHAKGMAHITDMVNQKIMPTPGSVMEATMILYEQLGPIITIDVGGATTDIHSVAEPSDDFKKYLEGEPLQKRTVEGDLGVFINHENVVKLFGDGELEELLNISKEELEEVLKNYTYMPRTQNERNLVYELAKRCTHKALDRHVGDLRRVFTSSGQKIIPEGKDLSCVEYIVLTGGALINLHETEEIVRDYLKRNQTKMMPSRGVKILRDHDYIMASVGVVALKHPNITFELLKKSLRIE
ncbi:MAG: glutamate mutase L [Candidatus Izemoplasmataceae bacterium]